jgi:hypothetical protein
MGIANLGGSLGRMVGLKTVVKGEGAHLHQYTEEMPLLIDREAVQELDNTEMTKAQQMFEDKKVRRQKRRSLRESGDFLGVQGANPRTGYWDASTGTSSSEPSQMSDETKRRLDEEARNVENQRRKYEEAQSKHQAELSRVQTLRDYKKQEKAERKKLDLKLRQRRHGKWKLSENGWSSVAEPELSPIVQSLAGSPAIGRSTPLLISFTANCRLQRLLLLIDSFPCHVQPIQLPT